jgi:hypothetical protein
MRLAEGRLQRSEAWRDDHACNGDQDSAEREAEQAEAGGLGEPGGDWTSGVRA